MKVTSSERQAFLPEILLINTKPDTNINRQIVSRYNAQFDRPIRLSARHKPNLLGIYRATY